VAGTYLAGKNAHVSMDGSAAMLAFRVWKAALKCVKLVINDFLSAGFQTLLPGGGFISATITLDGAYLAGATPLAVGEIHPIELGFSPTILLTITAFISEITVTVDAEKEEVLSVTADSTGPFVASIT